MKKRLMSILFILPLLAFGAAAPATADDAGEKGDKAHKTAGNEEINELLAESQRVVQQMQADPEMKQLLSQSKGVFLVPDYAKGGLGVGARGGEGVMLAHRDGQWNSPVFYDFGGVSVGAQAGFEAGQIAMVLMSDKAVESFHSENNFSLNADAGLTLVDWSARVQGSVGKGDVVVWSDTEGAFAGADISVTDIHWDEEENQRLYGEDATARETLTTASVENPHARELKAALSGTGTDTGATGAGMQADVEADEFETDADIQADVETDEFETDTRFDTDVEATTADTDYDDRFGAETEMETEGDLPATGSELPLFALLGLLSVAAAIGVRSLVR